MTTLYRLIYELLADSLNLDRLNLKRVLVKEVTKGCGSEAASVSGQRKLATRFGLKTSSPFFSVR